MRFAETITRALRRRALAARETAFPSVKDRNTPQEAGLCVNETTGYSFQTEVSQGGTKMGSIDNTLL